MSHLVYSRKNTLFYEQLEIKVGGKIKVVMSPIYVRIYDNGGETSDRYTVVFTGNYPGRVGCDYLGMSTDPTSPLGIFQHGWNNKFIDRPTYTHLGKSIRFKDLPTECQKIVMTNYKILWGLESQIIP